MSDILADLPVLLPCLVRKEFTLNFEGGQGEYLKAHVLGIRCQEGHSLQFQVRFEEPGYGGAMFCLPIQAICWKPCDRPPCGLVQPWDCFSRHFAVHEFRLLRNSKAIVLNQDKCQGFPDRLDGRYLFTVDFVDSALADCFEQHKQLHFVQLESGWFAAVPNNRVLMHDTAFAKTAEELPKFASLAHNYCGEVTFHLP